MAMQRIRQEEEKKRKSIDKEKKIYRWFDVLAYGRKIQCLGRTMGADER